MGQDNLTKQNSSTSPSQSNFSTHVVIHLDLKLDRSHSYEQHKDKVYDYLYELMDDSSLYFDISS